MSVAEAKKPEGFDLYSRFALAGALGCSITHGAFTPVDVYMPLYPQPPTPNPHRTPTPRTKTATTPLPRRTTPAGLVASGK